MKSDIPTLSNMPYQAHFVRNRTIWQRKGAATLVWLPPMVGSIKSLYDLFDELGHGNFASGEFGTCYVCASGEVGDIDALAGSCGYTGNHKATHIVY